LVVCVVVFISYFVAAVMANKDLYYTTRKTVQYNIWLALYW